ncbi:MAG: response regulator [Coriobacteriia bacterium]|nr:response regulator [Coriobacteriia bacterium]
MPGHRILVVEDTELLRRMYHDRLVADGFEVTTAGDGLDAINELRNARFDLIVLDLIMPRMGGLEALEIIKSDPRLSPIPVVILTNLGEEGAIERALELGAVDYLIKNAAKPADVSAKIKLTLEHLAPPVPEPSTVSPSNPTGLAFKVLIRDREAEADALVAHARLQRRFWCPACEQELYLELVPNPDREGWYEAHLLCTNCGREY